MSIEIELAQHVLDKISDEVLTNENQDDWHYYAFNEDYYIIGYYNAEQWLENHNVSPFDAIADVIQWENDVLGEVTLKPDDMDSERIVNLYVYVKGEELNLPNYHDIEELTEAMQDIIAD